MLKLSVITDEISQDFEEALQLAKQYGLPFVEIRSVWNKPPQELEEKEIREIQALCGRYGVRVCAISSSFYKCDFTPENVAENLAMLEKLISLAQALGCRIIRGFSFWRQGNFARQLPQLAGAFAAPGALLQQAGMCLALEADPSVNACSSELLAALLKEVNHPAVCALWDPGNDVFAPVSCLPPMDAYERLRPYIRHVHIKDARRINGGVDAVKLGEGEVDWPALLAVLLRDGYSGCVSLETHYRLQARLPEALLKRPMGKDFSAGGYEASEECLQALAGMLAAQNA